MLWQKAGKKLGAKCTGLDIPPKTKYDDITMTQEVA